MAREEVIPPISFTSGDGDLQRCGSRLLPGRMGLLEFFSKALVQPCDAGELQDTGVSGPLLFQAKCDLFVGTRKRPVDGEDRTDRQFVHRLGVYVCG